MNKPEIADLIDEKHNSLLAFLADHPTEKWNQGPENKWTAGQHVVHLIQSYAAMNKGLGIPKLLLHYKFGKANRGPRTYDEVVANYYNKMSIAGDVVSPVSLHMPDTPVDGKQKLIEELTEKKEVIKRRLSNLSEKQMDKYLLPHPLMGRMLLREVIMWSAFHVEHHMKILHEKY